MSDHSDDRSSLVSRPFVEVNAHAKINLLLNVLAREETGYHSIETVFQRIALHDIVRVGIASDRVLECHGPAMPAGGLGDTKRNLAWRAAESYMNASSWHAGFAISIEKHIPVGGGLGGGSADAAAVLRALDDLAPYPLGLEALLRIASQLGADVPFLLTGWSRALGWSRGDRLLQLPALASRAVTLVAFETGIDTAHAYRALAAERGAYRSAARAIASLDTWEQMVASHHNDFEAVAVNLHMGVDAVLPQLRDFARMHPGTVAMMSGSGATCFMVHPREAPPLPALQHGGARYISTRTA